MRVPLALLIAAVIAVSTAAFAVDPDEMLADPALEARARTISAELRCLVCQNQSIDDSDADLAHDLRVIVRERLTSGDTNEQVLQYVVARYGEFVLLRPVVAWHTLVLWIAAPVLLLVGLVAIVIGTIRRRGRAGISELSEDETRALASLGETGAKD